MMRTCRKVLNCIRTLRKEHNWYPHFNEIARKSGFHPADVDGACAILEKQGYIQYGYPVIDGKTSLLPDCVFLTLKRRKPIEYGISQLGEYLKKNWIAILALVISFVSLLQSLGLIALLPKEYSRQQSPQGYEQTDFRD